MADGNPTNNDQLHHYWTRDPRGLEKWVKSDKPWTTLKNHLAKFVGEERAKRMASQWFFEIFGFHSGSDLNRVAHGKPPRGKVIGPG
ncbi:MAG: hypothetical protein HOV78_11320 [Hamadaea sp.]|nr:hypothetical protein [Hamadaea sp.]